MLDLSRCTPWLLEVPITPPAGSTGNTAAPGSFVNPAKGPVVVDEIRFSRITSLKMNTRATIQVGRFTVCDDVPLSVLCKPQDHALDGVYPAASIIAANTFQGADQSYVWRLPKALLLPMGAKITVSLRSQPVLVPSSAWNLAGYVSIIGRSLPDDFELPSTVHVPYATHWTISGSATADLIAASNQGDLRNRLQVPIRVRRFTADLAGDYPGNGGLSEVIDPYGMALAAKIRIYGQNGVLGVRDLTPVGVLMNFGRRTWKVDAALGPNGYYIAEFAYPASPFNASSTNIAFSIGMIGTHRESLDAIGEEVR